MKIFNLDLDGYTAVDIKNAFKVLAENDDNHIDMNIIDDIVSELDIP